MVKQHFEGECMLDIIKQSLLTGLSVKSLARVGARNSVYCVGSHKELTKVRREVECD